MTVVASSTHVRVAVDHTLIAKIGKVKDLALILLIKLFSPSNFSSKFCCCSSTFTNVLFTSLLTKNIERKY